MLRFLAQALSCLGLVSALLAAPVRAQGPFEGDWRVGPMRREVAIGSWGDACGPRPSSTTSGGGSTIHVTQDGDHLRLGSRSTRGCWSDNPAVRRLSNSYTSGTWRILCRTPPDDGRAETATTTLTASGSDRVEMRDVTEYDWSLSGSHCTATVTSTRTYDRAPAGVPDPGTDPDPVPDPGPTRPTPTPACSPGPAARVALRPTDADLEPGERICFSARVTDAAGCAVRGSVPSLALTSPAGRTGTLRGSCFEAADSAAAGEGTFVLVATSGSMRAEASIRVRTMDLSDLIARPSDVTGPAPTDLGAATSDTAAGVAARAAEVRADAPWLALALGAIGLLIAAVAAIALLGRRRERRRRLERAEAEAQARHDAAARAPIQAVSSGPAALEPSAESVAAPGAAQAPPVSVSEPRICPTCRRGQPANVATCPHDGTPLVTYAEFAAKPAPSAGGSICPVCGTSYPATTRFCGKDGTTLPGV